MGEAIGQVLPMAVGVALSPIPIIAVVLMLVTAKAKVNGPMFIVGWLIGLAVIGVIVIAIVGPNSTDDDGDASGVGWIKIVLGVLLLLVALKEWRNRPKDGEQQEMPKWMGAIDSFTPLKSAGLGVLLSALNPKNLLLSVAAGTAVAAVVGLSGGEQVVAYGVFTLIATIGVAAPVVIYFVMGDRAPALLGRLRTWMAANNAVIMAVLMLVIGVKILGDGIGSV